MLFQTKYLKENLKEAVLLLSNEIIEELVSQGHKATGKLISSINQKVTVQLNSLIGEIEMLYYGRFVDEGVKAEKVKIGRKYIDAIVRWLKVKKFQGNNKKLRGIAFAIGNKHKKEGIPTKASSRFSKDGRRKEFVNIAFKRREKEVTRLIEDATQKDVEIFFEKRFKNVA